MIGAETRTEPVEGVAKKAWSYGGGASAGRWLLGAEYSVINTNPARGFRQEPESPPFLLQ